MLSLRLFKHVVDPDQQFWDKRLFFRFINEGPNMTDYELLAADEASDPPRVATQSHTSEPPLELLHMVAELTRQNLFLQVVSAAFAVAAVLRGALGWTLALGLFAYALYRYSRPVLHAEAEPASKEAGPVVSEPNSERLVRLRAALAEFPEAQALYSDSFLASVLSAPDRNHPDRPRSLAYSKDKMLSALQWRRDVGANELTPEQVAPQLACGSLYWHGFDCEDRPVLWVHPTRKDWKNLDLAQETRLHVLMIEEGVRHMPPHVTNFTVIACCEGLGLKDVSIGLAVCGGRSLASGGATVY
jgi:hypothetical protein